MGSGLKEKKMKNTKENGRRVYKKEKGRTMMRRKENFNFRDARKKIRK